MGPQDKDGTRYYNNAQTPAAVDYVPMTPGYMNQAAQQMSQKSAERDPSGMSASTPGAKLDAGKQRPWLVLHKGFGRALQAVTRIGTKGAAKYSDDGWKSVANGFERYMEAYGRHVDAIDRGETFDNGPGGTNESHLMCMVWNLLAAEEFRLARLAGFANVQQWHDSLGLGTPPIADILVGTLGGPVALSQMQGQEQKQARGHSVLTNIDWEQARVQPGLAREIEKVLTKYPAYCGEADTGR